MSEKLKVLIVEDSERDAMLLVRQLKLGGYAPEFERVDTREGLIQALSEKNFDIIISDYSMPSFTALDALNIFKEKKLDIPFIVVSGAIGEDVAVEALVAGAHDFIVKGKWERLIPAIKRELQDVIVRKESAEVHQKAKLYLEVASVLMLSLNREGIVTLINPKGCEVLGYKEEEILGKNWFDNFLPEHLRNDVKAVFEELMAGKIEPVEYYENPILDSDGNEKLIAWHNSILRDDAGNITQTFGSGEDITEKTKALESLRISEEKYRNIVETSNDWIWEFDENAIFTYISPNIQQLLGYQPEEILGKSAFDVMPPDQAEKVYKEFKVIRDARRSFTLLQNINQHKDGHLVILESSGVPIFDASGQFKGYRGIDRDITERISMEKALIKSEENFRSVVTNSQAIIFMIDKDGDFKLSEGKGLELLGLKPGEVVGKSAFELYKDNPEVVQAIKSTLLSGKPLREIQKVNNLFMDVSYTPAFENNNEIIGLTGTAVDVTKRVQAEQTLRKSEEKYKDTISHLGEGFFSVSTEGVLHDFNNEFQRIVGVEKKKEMMNSNVVDFWQNPEVRKDYLAKLREEGIVRDYEMQGKKLNGEKITVLINARTVMGEQGEIIRIEGTARDITEKRKVLEELKKSENRLENAQQIAKLGSWELDLEKNVLTWSKENYHIFGMNPDDFGASYEAFLDLVHPDDREYVRKAYPESLKTKKPYDIVHRLLMKDGTIKYVQEICNTVYDENGKPLRSRGTTQDITERKVAEESLKMLKSAIEQTAEMVVITNYDGLVEYVNPAFEKMTEYRKDEVMGEKTSILSSGQQNEEFYKSMWDTIKSGEIWKGSLINKKKSGELYDEEMTISPIQNEKGDITHFVAIKADVSDDKRLQEQLIHTEKLSTVGTFVSGVAHELNNPLTAVIGYSETLMEDESLSERAKDIAKIIFTQSNRTVDIVKNLLKFSRKESNEMTALSILEILDSVIQLHSYRLKGDNIEVITDYQSNLSLIKGNTSQLQQVFMNLIVNAHQAILTSESSETEGIIKFIATKNETHITIKVENNGPTIPEEHLSKLFDPFFTTKEAGEGTGLGMYISHRIIESHGGKIFIENVEGSGVCVTITLPILPEVKQEKIPQTEQATMIRGLNILLIDDDEPIREYIAELLLREGSFCATARDGEEGINYLRESTYDVIISDIKMPKITGFEVVEWLHEHKPEQLKNVILLTGVVDQAVENFCKKYQCTCLIKPILKADLLGKIQQTLNRTK